MVNKLAKHITMHRYDFSDKSRAIKGLIVLYPWVLEYRITLHANDALDSLDDHLKIEGEPPPPPPIRY